MPTSMPILALNAQGDQVKIVQINLSKIGLTVPATETRQSVFSSGTTDVVKQFHAQRKMDDLDKSPGIYTAIHRCTSVALEVTDAGRLRSIPKGTGNIDIPLCDDAIGVSTPYHLNKARKDSRVPVKILKGSDFAGHGVPVR